MAEAVYGKEHTCEHHKCEHYKPKYLKTHSPHDKMILAYPNGLPKWGDSNGPKVHLIGHSKGAATIRYFQYLLQTGYFDELSGVPKTDRSHLIASITCLSGALNGSNGVEYFGLGYDRKEGGYKVQEYSKT